MGHSCNFVRIGIGRLNSFKYDVIYAFGGSPNYFTIQVLHDDSSHELHDYSKSYLEQIISICMYGTIRIQ